MTLNFILNMALEELTAVLGKEYAFKYEHMGTLLAFLSNTQTLSDLKFHISYNICRASGEKFVLNKLSFNQLEKLLLFYSETLPRVNVDGNKTGQKRASTIHQNFANVYSRLFDIDGKITHLEKAIEHSIKSTEYAGTDAHKAYTFGFIGEFARKIFQKTKNRDSLPWSEKALEFYKKSRELSNNPSHKAHCLSYMADVLRDIHEITGAAHCADKAIDHYIDSSNEIRKMKPAQAFHNLSYAGDVAFLAFTKTDNSDYLKKSHSLYHMALREEKTKKQEAFTRINLLRSACKLYDRLHNPSFVQEALHHAITALETELTFKSESYVIATLADLCVKLPPDFIILQDNLQKLIPFAQKFQGDNRAHVLLSSIYRNRFGQTNDSNDLKLMFDSLDKAIELANIEEQKAHNGAWAGRSAYHAYTQTKSIEHLKKAYNYHEMAGTHAKKSHFYAGLCAQELYDLTNDEQWKNKALTQYVHFLNSPSPDFNKANNAREHIQELTQ
jgi:tetratricopeptide (TPR) repeat protein